MPKRKFEFEDNCYYHVYNRGVDKREIFLDKQDLQYFIDRIQDFNNVNVFGSAKNMKYKERRVIGPACDSNVVEILAVAGNPNHFHFILKQVRSSDDGGYKGVSSFIQRLCTGQAMYFNKKYKRSGALFQGRFKAVKIQNEGHLKDLVVYLNLNYKVHKLDPKKHLVWTSYEEYLGKNKGKKICWKREILGMFKNIKDFEKYTENKINEIIKERELLKKEENNFIE